LIIAALLGAGGGIAAIGTRSSNQPTALPTLINGTGTVPASAVQPSAPGRRCLPSGRAIKTPSFYPHDLPLPPGSFATQVLPSQSGVNRVIFTAEGDLRSFVQYVLGEWPKRGWRLGRGEAEPGEAEDQFAQASTGLYGAFKAQSTLCDETQTWVLIVLGKRASPSPSS
jgi:hypothetical protein